MAPKAKVGVFTYADIAALTDHTTNYVHQAVSRGELDLERLDTILQWIARHARKELAAAIVGNAIQRSLAPDVKVRKSRATERKARTRAARDGGK